MILITKALSIPSWYEKKCREIIKKHYDKFARVPDLEEMCSYLWVEFLYLENQPTEVLLHFKNAAQNELKTRLKQKVESEL